MGKLTKFEVERQQRIAENMRRMAELEVKAAADALAAAGPALKKQRRVIVVKRQRDENEPVRRSGRILSLPAPTYADELPRERLCLRAARCGRGDKGAKHHGLPSRSAAAATDPWHCAPRGWKPECGSASNEASVAAYQAATKFVKELEAEGRQAFVKEMSYSQVAGGFWMSAPWGLAEAYGTDKMGVIMVCEDAAAPDASTFVYTVEGSTTEWPVIFLPRSSGSGLSGGWRGFAIDQQLCPNDIVVFEAMPTTEGGSSCGSSGSKSGPGRSKKKYMKVHIFRAKSFEQETGGASAARGEGSTVSDAASGISSAAAGAGASAGDAATDADAAAAAGEDDLEDVPLAKRRKTAAAAAAGAAADGGADVVPHAAADTAKRSQVDQAGAAQGGGKGGKQLAAAGPAAPPAPTRSSKRQRSKRQSSQAAGPNEDGSKAAGPKKGQSGGKGKGKSCQAACSKLVPQPANPSVLVAAPTADETARDAAGGPFWVKWIMGHKVDASGEDKFLIRWHGFSAWWDSWEGRGCLDAPPHTYAWHGGQDAIPAKFRRGRRV